MTSCMLPSRALDNPAVLIVCSLHPVTLFCVKCPMPGRFSDRELTTTLLKVCKCNSFRPYRFILFQLIVSGKPKCKLYIDYLQTFYKLFTVLCLFLCIFVLLFLYRERVFVFYLTMLFILNTLNKLFNLISPHI